MGEATAIVPCIDRIIHEECICHRYLTTVNEKWENQQWSMSGGLGEAQIQQTTGVEALKIQITVLTDSNQAKDLIKYLGSGDHTSVWFQIGDGSKTNQERYGVKVKIKTPENIYTVVNTWAICQRSNHSWCSNRMEVEVTAVSKCGGRF